MLRTRTLAGATVLCLLILALAATGFAHAAPRASDDSASIAAKKKKKKCKVTQKRNKRGKCVKKKCKTGYKLSRKGKCVKIPAKPNGPPAPDPRSDTDGDGVPYSREIAFGGNPMRKDMFVQMNFSSAAVRSSLACDQLDAIYNAFLAAPVANPDGSQGIKLHLDAGVNCPSREYDMGGSTVFNIACATNSQGMNAAALALPESRVGTFRSASMVDTCSSGGEGGVAQFLGVNLTVSTNGSGFAHPLMHELGHTMGLDHGVQPVPNRISDMNGVITHSNTGSSGQNTEVIDFQRVALPALDESNLSEAAGIGVAPPYTLYVGHSCGPSFAYAWLGAANGGIDWNCNTPLGPGPPLIDPGTVSYDINGDGQLTVLPATFNEWAVIDITAGGNIRP